VGLVFGGWFLWLVDVGWLVLFLVCCCVGWWLFCGFLTVPSLFKESAWDSAAECLMGELRF